MILIHNRFLTNKNIFPNEDKNLLLNKFQYPEQGSTVNFTETVSLLNPKTLLRVHVPLQRKATTQEEEKH